MAPGEPCLVVATVQAGKGRRRVGSAGRVDKSQSEGEGGEGGEGNIGEFGHGRI